YLLLDFARLEERTGNLNAAREYGENAINIIESQRESFSNDELRASFAAGSRGFYDFQIGLLMKLHALDRTKGNDAIAFQLSERSRARGLLNVLNEARAEVMQGGDRTLLEREKRLRVQINDKARRLTQALSSKASEKRGEAIEKELNTLLADLQTVRAQIRISSPRYAALTQPQPLAVKELQAKLDDNTVLLEYALMPERSFLWAVSRNAFKSYEVPKHSEIETLSRRAYELFTRSHERAIRGQAQLAAAELSQKILGPVAAELKGKRLIIVGDGALQYVPFAALPEPANIEKGAVDEKTILHPLTSNPQPLIINHDLVYLPSASLLSLLGQERGSVKQAEKTIAVLADPVFQLNDQRVTKSLVARNSPQVNTATLMAQTRGGFDQLTRSASETGTAGFARLPYTRQEAEAIFSLTSTRDGLKALDFKANRESATSKELSQYRILHFATHGLINSQHPELSGLVLSLVDEKGEPQDGFLRLHDIYNLNLNADLVVLSACRTALGKEVNGEGLIGLTRGFMYAGAKSVIASLWDVRDEATAELMKRFYHNMLKQGQLPSAALRAAQISVLQEPRWSAPYFWAGFTMQGAWK
ncbi:MAG TPA: CHAT domain-containing protein, partial [Blastocatellia bacterium]|nr:CHAT domain-containing protein [Blastocatellia bacterium]